MGGSRAGSVGSYSSGSASVGDVLGKYGTNAADGTIAKMEQDIVLADKGAKKKQKTLEKTAADKKAEDVAKFEGVADSEGSIDGEREDPGDKGVKNITVELQKRTVEEIFAQFDTDNSGLIDFDEFQAMLPQLGIKMAMPKALKYFRMCDSDGTGEIDLEEFKVAVFAVDPDSGNPVGFAPNTLLTPLDAFEMFDEDKSGQIDEDEFFFLLQYLGLEVSELVQEQMFNKYDKDKSGFIEYSEFKKIWVRLANVKKELTDRGVKIPKLATKGMLSNMLEEILDAEEDRERRAIAEAERWAKWQMLLKDKRRAYEKARRRSTTELKSALDAGGSVWIFGTGPFGEFTAPAPKVLEQGGHEFAHYEVIRGIWNTRVNPPPTAPEPITLGQKHERRRRKEMGLGNKHGENENDGSGDGTSSQDSAGVALENHDNHPDPEEDARTSPFAGLCVGQCTAALWGRRIASVTTSDSTAFGVSELGEGYAWGGKDHWWFDIRPDSHWQTHWRGDTTERSRLLLQTLDKVEPEELESEDEEDVVEQEIEKLRTITTYFGVWKPPPTNQRLQYIKDELVPKIKHQQAKYSLECRGKHVEDMNKTELLDLLYEDIVLEKKVLGERLHRRIRQLELETIHMYEKGKTIMAKCLRREIEEMWTPLREIQAEDAAVKRASMEAIKGTEHAESEERYSKWREQVRKARDDAKPAFTPRGNSLEVSLGGVTARAGGMKMPRANDAAVAIAAGANHVVLVHRSGQLYTWGVGASGRLGLDLSQGGNPQSDTPGATVIQAFAGRPVIRACAGYNHSAAITASGRVYTWGSAATGKLGLGKTDRDVYCSVPMRVMVDTKSKVKEISCGAAHTACVTASGQLFVWGCGDGGRLGLGEDRLSPQCEPVLVEALREERIASVSCGNSHTLVLTAVREVFEGEGAARAKMLRGGHIWQAGSTNVLGTFCPDFIPVHGLETHTVRQVSAGYGHSCCITTEGELYTWGSNRDGCLGLPRVLKFVKSPTLVPCLYASPKNLAAGCPARQSSVYDDLGAGIAVDGDVSGNESRKCSCTQQDPQGWWEVDLGELVYIHQVKIWNRCDEPADPSLERNFYAKRLFPCWVMASQEAFREEVGGAALLDAMNLAVARAHLKQEQRCSVWKCPDQTMARYVRVQLEGFDFLHLAQVEVYGTKGARRSPGRVTQCCAGKYVTTAVVAAVDNPADVELVYMKAVQANAFNAEVLRQLETFFSSYDSWGRGDAIKRCLLCKAGSLCEICSLKHEFRDELRELPLGPGGSLHPLTSIAQYLFDVEKPSLNYQSPTKQGTGVFHAVRDGINKIFAPLQGSVGGSGNTSISSDASDTTTQLPGKMNAGAGGTRSKKGKKGWANVAQAESDDGTASMSSLGGGGDDRSDYSRANREYHVGALSGNLSSSRSSVSGKASSTLTTNSSDTGSSDRSSYRGTGQGGGRSVSVSNSSGYLHNSGGEGGITDRSSGTLASAATGTSRSSGYSRSRESSSLASSRVVGGNLDRGKVPAKRGGKTTLGGSGKKPAGTKKPRVSPVG